MNIDYLILADRAEVLNGKIYLMGGGWDRISLSAFPGNASFAIAIGFTVDYSETDEKHSFTLRIEDEDGKVVNPPFGGEVTVGRPPGFPRGDEQHIPLAVNTMQPIPKPGRYIMVAEVPGSAPFRRAFRVIPSTGSQVA